MQPLSGDFHKTVDISGPSLPHGRPPQSELWRSGRTLHAGRQCGAIRSAREADAVSVRIEHYKRRRAPRLFPQRLSKRDSSSFVLCEKTLDVIDADKGRQQAILPFANAGSEDWLVDEPEVELGGASTHGAVERRIAVYKIDRKAESQPAPR
jgi:hypothetical protein